jgi:DNA-binding NtrC family response regulator
MAITSNSILVVEDDEKLQALLSRILKNEGFDVYVAQDCKTALKKLSQTDIDVVLSDVKLPDGNGVELAKEIKEKYPITEIIILTAFSNIPDSVQAIKNGAFNYLTKGDDNDKIIPLIYHALEKVSLNKQIQSIENKVVLANCFEAVKGESKAVKAAIELGRKVAVTDATVLLCGETGTGKEVFAKAIHQCSNRCNNNFIAVNCAAFSKDLLESEFFGHKAGSFTGAVRDNKGIFEEANGGTIFLDEAGEMPQELQVKLLRVLECGEFLKVGDSKPTQVDVRIIAATNRDLSSEIETGKFRQDLFYRLSVFQITLPPLRERNVDIEELATHFLKFFAMKSNKKGLYLSHNYIEALKLHTWPGNIRELRNIIERSVILTDDKKIDINTLPNTIHNSYERVHTGNPMSSFDLANAERIHIQKVINYTNGNKAETARLLNIAITTLYRKLAEYQIGT